MVEQGLQLKVWPAVRQHPPQTFRTPKP